MTAVHRGGWAKVKTAARYADVSERTLRGWLKDGLEHVRIKTGTILIKYTWIDEYLEKHRVSNKNEIDKIVNEVLKGVL
ncbi:MAG: hypothetical protein VR64_21295 [Desulfatitalea sp. BRH_c12]|nr:MAG: hypothetical protein VR64_21295 [Desulfatitalea sp. BRH_c12]